MRRTTVRCSPERLVRHCRASLSVTAERRREVAASRRCSFGHHRTHHQPARPHRRSRRQRKTTTSVRMPAHQQRPPPPHPTLHHHHPNPPTTREPSAREHAAGSRLPLRLPQQLRDLSPEHPPTRRPRSTLDSGRATNKGLGPAPEYEHDHPSRTRGRARTAPQAATTSTAATTNTHWPSKSYLLTRAPPCGRRRDRADRAHRRRGARSDSPRPRAAARRVGRSVRHYCDRLAGLEVRLKL